MLLILLATAVCAAACPEVPQSPAEQGHAAKPPRGMVVDDLFRLSELEDVAMSPDGKWLLATLTRPGVANPAPTSNYKATGDVWLLDIQTGEWRDVTNGGADGSSAWSPVWSPDGKRIAFVSTRGTRDIRLHVHDVTSGKTTSVAEAGVYMQADIRAQAWDRAHPFLWLDDSSLLVALLPEGTNAVEQILYWQRGVAESTRAWEKWSRGEVSASVLDSGVPAPPLPTVDLQRVDVAGGAPRALATLPRWDLWDLRLRLQVDVTADRRRAAFVTVTGTLPLDPKVAITDAIRTFTAGWFPLDVPAAPTFARLDALSHHVDGELMGWAPDGNAFVIREAAEPGTRSHRRRWLRVLASGDVRPIELPQARIGRIAWTRGSQLLVRATPEQSATTPARTDWWRLDGDGAPHPLTAYVPHCPAALVAARGSDRLLGADSEALWSIDPTSGTIRRLCTLGGASIGILPAGSSPNETTLLTSDFTATGPGLAHITVSAAADAAEVVRIGFPTATSSLLAGDPRLGVLAFRDNTPTGTTILTTDGAGQHAVVRRHINAHIAEIAEGERSLITYRSADGRDLNAAVILPPGHVPGTRLPVVAWVYGGMLVHDTKLAIASKSSTRPLNLELLAGHGYAVVVPSVPLPAAGANGDPMTAIPKSVLPCIDRVIELGIGDPQRLAVMGHSTGGYTTYAVVTQTDRFRAAIALSGHPDLVSLHTQLFPGERTNARAHEGLATAMFTEDEPLYLGGPPWSDMARYVRNSPLTFLDRVTTPLLIVHGDMDGAPIQQGEQAFVGLYRLGKRARFVRYWGEGHVVGSAANVRHLWSQIFAWLDTHLAAPPQQPR